MGKKEKNKKKGKGAEKTAEKTQKKMRLKAKKATGEDDIEAIVKAIEDEERKRKEVKETAVGPPSHRSNLTVCAHPDNPELVFFGGEFHNGNKTVLFNDMLIYNTKRRDWTQVKSPAGPPPRSSHQAVISAQSGGQMWMFGGEFASASESQFHHYRDLWVYYFASKRWEKVVANGGNPPPTSRSGHRMVLVKRHLVIFGGFHDNLSDCKYFDDVHVFSLEERVWRSVTVSGSGPGPRSGVCMAGLHDGRILVYGGFCKEKKKKLAGGRKKDAGDEEGKTMADMYILAADKHDETLSKWRWLTVKQIGARPCPRSGLSCVPIPGTNRVVFFGGVQDNNEDGADSDDDDEVAAGNFFNDLHTVNVDNERATWQLVDLTRKKGDDAKARRRKDKELNSEGNDGGEAGTAAAVSAMSLDNCVDDDSTKVVEDGVFTISSTIALSSSQKNGDGENGAESTNDKMAANSPSPRFGSSLAIKQGVLYLFGGLVEDDEDRQMTHKDLYCIDLHKMDAWETLIESDVKTMEWVDSESDDEDDDSEEESDDEDMETS